MTRNQLALDTAIWAGRLLLESGAEISRVNSTIILLLEAFGIDDHNVYVISNGIFATAGETGSAPGHAVRTVNLSSVHLGRIVAVNELSREIVTKKTLTDMDEIRKRLEECEKIKPLPMWLQFLACAMGAGGFAYIMGGSGFDAVASFLAGFLLQGFLIIAGKVQLNRFISNILGGGWVTLASWILFSIGIGHSIDRIIIGAIIPLVPGVLLTTSIRDFFNSDYVSGVIHLVEALLIAACIAVGVGGTLSAIHAFGGGM